MPQDFVDLVRILHLLCFALGMGSGLYFDCRAICRFNTPFTEHDVAEFHRVHNFVFLALFGLWVTGLMMIHIRTGFVVAEFTPKLWTKLIVVSVLTLNAFLIGRLVLARIATSVGQRASELPLRTMLPMTIAACLSVFCWLSGLILGISVTLKTATWETLGAFFLVEFAVIVPGMLVGVMILRTILRRRNLHHGNLQGQHFSAPERLRERA